MADAAMSLIPEADEPRSLSMPEQQGEMLKGASWMAKELKTIIEANDLAKNLGGKKKHLELEAWTTVARIQNEQPHSKFVRCFEDSKKNEVVEAHAWVTDASGKIVSEADAMCSTEERNWAGKPLYARVSMAQTRAMSKALRLRHSWIMVMAGYSPTPADEMEEEFTKAPPKSAPKKETSKPSQIQAEPPSPQEGAPASSGGDKVDVIVRQTAANGRGVCITLCDPQGNPISDEDIWWNTFHKGAFDRLKEAVGTHVVLNISHTVKGDKTWTNIESIDG